MLVKFFNMGLINMAETMGSLIDKLIITKIREWHIKTNEKYSKLRSDKLNIVIDEKNDLILEIDEVLKKCIRGEIKIKRPKVKLYCSQNRELNQDKIHMGRLIEKLAETNMALWNLEDEARRTDVDLSYIGRIKQKIDKANIQRNDLIDQIDETFEEKILEIIKNR